MKSWWPLLAAILLPGGCILALGVWSRRRWLAREAAQIDALIRPARPVFEKLSAKEYDEVRAEAARRHVAQSYRQKQSRQIASGETIEPQIRIVGHR
jgi:hypothetical protein